MDSKPWHKNWEKIRDLDGGGQASVKLVKHRDSDTEAVLKILNRQRNTDRRARMYREVAALQSLDVDGIPNVFESNAHEFEEILINLYFVMEYIPGKTLFEIVSASPLGHESSVRFGLRILEILAEVHDADLVHRDLKPDNVILKADNPEAPYLVDFGLTFNAREEPRPLETEATEQMGNRFLALPELLTDGGPKRDPRSDVTQANGLVFYARTGVFPRTLLGHDGQFPHQTENTKPDLGGRFLAYFDKAFQVPLGQRWQSARVARAALEQLLDEPCPPTEGVDSLIESITRKMKDGPELQSQFSAKSKIESVILLVYSAVQDACDSLGEGFAIRQGGRRIESAKYIGQDTIGISIGGDAIRHFSPTWTVRVTGTDVVLSSEIEGQVAEVYRFPMSESADKDNLGQKVKQIVLAGLNKLVDAV